MENAVRECGARAAKGGAKGVTKGGFASRHTGLKDSVPRVVAGEDMAPDLETQLLVMTAEGMRRLSRAQREAHLDAELQNRFTICTPFNVVERVYRLSCEGTRTVPMEELLAHFASDAGLIENAVLRVVAQCVLAGVLEAVESPSGAVEGYRLTFSGQCSLMQSKRVRLALWEVRPSKCIGEVLAIVSIEGGDPLAEAIEDRLNPSFGAVPKRGIQDGTAAAGSLPTWPAASKVIAGRKVNALWAGLLSG